MLRLVTSCPALTEAHVQAERADTSSMPRSKGPFARYHELERRLQAFDRQLEDARFFLRQADCLGNDRIHPDCGRRPLKRETDRRLTRGTKRYGLLPSFPHPQRPSL